MTKPKRRKKGWKNYISTAPSTRSKLAQAIEAYMKTLERMPEETEIQFRTRATTAFMDQKRRESVEKQKEQEAQRKIFRRDIVPVLKEIKEEAAGLVTADQDLSPGLLERLRNVASSGYTKQEIKAILRELREPFLTAEKHRRQVKQAQSVADADSKKKAKEERKAKKSAAKDLEQAIRRADKRAARAAKKAIKQVEAQNREQRRLDFIIALRKKQDRLEAEREAEARKIARMRAVMDNNFDLWAKTYRKAKGLKQSDLVRDEISSASLLQYEDFILSGYFPLWTATRSYKRRRPHSNELITIRAYASVHWVTPEKFEQSGQDSAAFLKLALAEP